MFSLINYIYSLGDFRPPSSFEKNYQSAKIEKIKLKTAFFTVYGFARLFQHIVMDDE